MRGIKVLGVAGGVKDIKDLKVPHLMICAKCHLPQLKEAEDSVAQETMKLIVDYVKGDEATSEKAKEKLKKLNINCLICHQRNAVIHKWVDGYPQMEKSFITIVRFTCPFLISWEEGTEWGEAPMISLEY